MLQKEVVDRMVAAPSASEYGRLSVMLQYRFEMERILDVPSNAFHPAPKVESAVVRMIPFARLPHPARDENRLTTLVAAAFAQRRKTLRNSLKGYFAAGDFERLTRETSVEVARARCLVSTETHNGAVRVLVVPQVRTDPRIHKIDDFALSEPLLRAICEVLEERRCVGVAVEVGTPFYQGVSVAALVRALPGRPVALDRRLRSRACPGSTASLRPSSTATRISTRALPR